MMFRGLTIFSFVSSVRGDDEQASLLQTASRDHAHLMARRANTIADFERELDGALAMKGGCVKYMNEEVDKPTAIKTKFEAEALVKEWKDTFNYKRKVKKDVRVADYCKKMITAQPAKTDKDFEKTKCKTVEKAKKQCSKSLKATCNFIRSTTKKLLKKAQKGTRKIRKEESFTALRDPLKTKVNEFSCKDYKKVDTKALTAAMFDTVNAHYDTVYGSIKTLKETSDLMLKASKEAKEAHKKALKDAKDAKGVCEKAAETAEKAALEAAKTAKDDAIKDIDDDADATKEEKNEQKKAVEKLYKEAVKKAKEEEEKADQACDDVYDASKLKAKEALKKPL